MIKIKAVILVETTMHEDTMEIDISEYMLSEQRAYQALIGLLITSDKLFYSSVIEHNENFYHVLYQTPRSIPPAVMTMFLDESIIDWLNDADIDSGNCMIDDEYLKYLQ